MMAAHPKRVSFRGCMKVLLSFVLLLAVVLNAIVAPAQAADAPRVSRSMLVAMEKSLDNRVTRLWDDNPFIMLGPTRGVYLDGYGAVFTAEINLVAGPGNMMMFLGPITKEGAEAHRQKKLTRVAELKRAMRLALVETAASMDTIPAEEQITIVAFLSKYPWEEMKDVPLQISMQGQKKRLLEAQRQGPAAAALLDEAISVQTTY
jgi:hypothetical protein